MFLMYSVGDGAALDGEAPLPLLVVADVDATAIVGFCKCRGSFRRYDSVR